MNAKDLLLQIANDYKLLEIGRKAVEDQLVIFRDSRISEMRNNGLVIKEYDGTPSHIIRMGTESAVHIALKAIAEEIDL